MNPPTAIPNTQKKGAAKKSGTRREEKTTKKLGNTMVFGDYVRARMAARALPRTPAQEEEEEEKRRRQGRRVTRPHTPPPFHHTPHRNTMTDRRQAPTR